MNKAKTAILSFIHTNIEEGHKAKQELHAIKICLLFTLLHIESFINYNKY